MNEKELYLQELKNQLDTWAEELEKMEAQSHMAEADLKIRYLDQLEALHQQREQARQQLSKLHESGDHDWNEVRAGTDEAWQKLRDAFAKAQDQFSR